MAAIATSQVSLYSSDGFWSRYAGGPQPRLNSIRRLKITGVTAGDTATAAVLGFSLLFAAYSAVYGATPTAFSVGVDAASNEVTIGAGPANSTVYLLVEGASIPSQ